MSFTAAGVACKSAVAITKSDTTVFPVTRGIYVGVAGDINLRTAAGETVVFKAAPVGILWIQADKVMETSTTATNMLALY